MNGDDDQHLSLVMEARANPKEPVDVHALTESLAAHFKMPAGNVAVAIVRHCVELSLHGLRTASGRPRRAPLSNNVRFSFSVAKGLVQPSSVARVDLA